MKLSFDQYICRIKEGWKDDPAVELCERIIRHIERVPAQDLKMLTFLSIGNILQRKPLDEEMVKALTILVSSSCHLLEVRHQYVDELGEHIEIEAEKYREIIEQGSFVHPHSGEEVHIVLERLIPYFTPTEQTFELKCSIDE